MGKNKNFAKARSEMEEIKKSSDSGRRAVDALFREHGYKIWSRAGDDEHIWEKAGVLFPEHEVRLRIPSEKLKDADYLENLYRDSTK